MTARVRIALATPDERRVDFHAWGEDCEGTLRDCNHVNEIVRELVGTDGAWVFGAPEGKREMFRIEMGVEGTRRGAATYRGCDYRRIEPCPMKVAEAGMEVYRELKRVLRRARRELVREKDVAK